MYADHNYQGQQTLEFVVFQNTGLPWLIFYRGRTEEKECKVQFRGMNMSLDMRQ